MPSMGGSADLEAELEARSVLLREVRVQNIAARIADVGFEAARALETGRTIFTLGNGGSAAQAQHLAAELVGRFRTERRALRSVALTADTAILTALGNDYGFETVFRRQIQAHVVAGDMVVSFSTSGNSPNVIMAVREAGALGALTVGLLGGTGGQLAKEVARAIIVPSTDTAQIQEIHLVICHLLCSVIDDHLRARGLA